MDRGIGRWVPWIEAIVLGVVGLGLFGWPTDAATAWPWTLPPLAARFVGAAFLGIAAAAAAIASWRGARGLPALAVMGLGTLLTPLTGILTPDVEVSAVRLAALTALLGTLAVAWFAVVRARPADVERAMPSFAWGRLSMPFVLLFAIHLALVTPVGFAMYVAPDAVADLWPWELSVVNVRLVGSIFLASAPLSLMALRDRDWASVYPIAAAYAVFATLALVATALHFGLFDPDRIRTWAFVAIYGYVAIGSIGAVARAASAHDDARRTGA